MAIIQIPNLSAAIGLSGTELLEAVQSGSSVKVSVSQISAYVNSTGGFTFPITAAQGGTGLTSYSIGDMIYASDTTALTKLNAASAGNVLLSGATPSWGKVALASFVSGTLPVANGGTNITSYTIGDILYASAAGVLSSLADVATGNALISGGVGVAPSYGKIGLTTHVSGTLPVANGGTNITSYVVGDLLYASTTGVLSSLADVATGNALISGGVGVAPSYGKIGLTTHVSGTLPVANGGTDITSYTTGDILYASAAGALSSLADVATGNALISGGVGAAPSYGKIGLATHVSGTLPLANGGTGVTTAPAAAAVLLGYTTTATAASTTTLTNTSSQYQLFTGSTTQTIVLPVTSTLAAGWSFHIVNNSTGSLTVNSSGGNLVATIIAGLSAMVTCIGTTLTTAADWEPGFTDFQSVTGTGSAVLGTGPTITSGVYSGTVGASSPSTGAFTTVTASTSVLSSGTGGVGYSTGAGVAVTQTGSRSTSPPTTGNSMSGAITLFTATATVGTYFSFTVLNSAIAVTDTVVLSVRGGSNTYVSNVTAITTTTSFRITMASVAGTASDTPIVNFTIIRGVSA
jgi:hypothetical protein